jgi:hypothetical protein
MSDNGDVSRATCVVDAGTDDNDLLVKAMVASAAAVQTPMSRGDGGATNGGVSDAGVPRWQTSSDAGGVSTTAGRAEHASDDSKVDPVAALFQSQLAVAAAMTSAAQLVDLWSADRSSLTTITEASTERSSTATSSQLIPTDAGVARRSDFAAVEKKADAVQQAEVVLPAGAQGGSHRQSVRRKAVSRGELRRRTRQSLPALTRFVLRLRALVTHLCAGWRLVHRLVWLPNQQGKLIFRLAVLRAVLRAKGEGRDRILRLALRRDMATPMWKKGSMTVIVRRYARPLTFISVVLATFGTAAFVLSLVAMEQSGVTSFPTLLFSLLLLGMGIMGVVGAKKRAEVASCVVFSYFYLAAALLSLCLIAVVWWNAFPVAVDRVLDRNWHAVGSIFPHMIESSSNRTVQLKQFHARLSQPNLYTAGIGVFFSMLVSCPPLVYCGSSVKHSSEAMCFDACLQVLAVLTSARQLRPAILCGSVFTVLHHLWIILSAIFVVFAIMLSSKPGKVVNATTIELQLRVCAAACVAVAVFGHFVSFGKRRLLLRLHLLVCPAAGGVGAWGAAIALAQSRRAERTLRSMTAAQLAEVAADVGLDGVEVHAIALEVQDMLYWLFTLNLAQAVTAGVMLVATASFLSSLRKVANLLGVQGILAAKAEAKAASITAAIVYGGGGVSSYNPGLFRGASEADNANIGASSRDTVPMARLPSVDAPGSGVGGGAVDVTIPPMTRGQPSRGGGSDCDSGSRSGSGSGSGSGSSGGSSDYSSYDDDDDDSEYSEDDIAELRGRKKSSLAHKIVDLGAAVIRRLSHRLSGSAPAAVAPLDGRRRSSVGRRRSSAVHPDGGASGDATDRRQSVHRRRSDAAHGDGDGTGADGRRRSVHHRRRSQVGGDGGNDAARPRRRSSVVDHSGATQRSSVAGNGGVDAAGQEGGHRRRSQHRRSSHINNAATITSTVPFSQAAAPAPPTAVHDGEGEEQHRRRSHHHHHHHGQRRPSAWGTAVGDASAPSERDEDQGRQRRRSQCRRESASRSDDVIAIAAPSRAVTTKERKQSIVVEDL